MSEIVYMDPMERYGAVLDMERIDWDYFKFEDKTFQVEVNMIKLVHIYSCFIGLFLCDVYF